MPNTATPGARRGDRARLARLKKFSSHYAVHFNGAAAVRFAGFETTQPAQYASELLSKPQVQAEVEKVIESLGDLHYRLADQAITKLTAMHNADRSAIFTPEGTLKDLDEWPEECKLLLAGIEVEELWEGQGAERRAIGVVRKVKLEAPKGIEDSILKVTGRWVDRTQFLDKNGKPTDPATSPQPIINVTVGK